MTKPIGEKTTTVISPASTARGLRIVIRGTNWIGDAVMATPALQRVRATFPQAHVALLATERTAGLFAGSALVDEILLYRRREAGVGAFFAMASTLRAGHFDAALLFQNAFEAALLAWLGRVPVRVGYALQGRGPLLTHGLHHPPEHKNRHQANDYLDIVSAAEQALLGQTGVVDLASGPTPVAQLPVSPSQVEAAQALLARHGLATRPFVALNAGATNSRAKCWPTAAFAALAERLTDELQANLVFIGAGSEQASAAAVIAQMHPAHQAAAYNLAGQTTIAELVGLLAQSRLLVSNDTGPAHIGAALGIPTLTLFGPTNEFETAPTGARAALMRAEGIECARCMHRDCPIDHRCMTQLTVAAVAQRALQLVAP